MDRQLTIDSSVLIRYVSVAISGLLLLIVSGGFWMWLQTSRPLDLHEAPVVFEVPQGAGLSAVAEELQQKGWIPAAVWLQIYGRLSASEGPIRAGEYLVSSDMTARSLLTLLRSGQVIQHRFTIIEGWTFDRIRDAIDRQPYLQHTLEALPPEVLLGKLGIHASHPEGFFFPDTYQYAKGTTDFSILQQSHDRMISILEREWHRRGPDLPYQSPYEALIMASIVEKETALEADRTKIAAVFLRRLRQNMRLQSDPTVIYGMGSSYNGDLTRSDLQHASSYNTYMNKGLPPTPICSPGLSSIRAALFPAKITSLYFVSRGDGSSEFSDTLEEHNKAVKQYQVMEKKR